MWLGRWNTVGEDGKGGMRGECFTGFLREFLCVFMIFCVSMHGFLERWEGESWRETLLKGAEKT